MVSLHLDGRTVVVTGAGQGQGAAEARLLAEAGARVIATDLSADMPAGLGAGSSASIGALVYRQLDVSDEADWSGLASWIRSQGWQVDGLVNNAGITQRSRLLDASVADLQKVYEVNVAGSLLGIQALSPLMRSAHRSSMWALLRGSPPTIRWRTPRASGRCAACPRWPRWN